MTDQVPRSAGEPQPDDEVPKPTPEWMREHLDPLDANAWFVEMASGYFDTRYVPPEQMKTWMPHLRQAYEWGREFERYQREKTSRTH